MLRKSVAVRVPVRLLDNTGTPVVGRTAADLLSGQFHVTKSSGVVVDVAASGANFFEINATSFPGLYHLLLPSNSVDVLGPVQWSVVPAAGAFIPVVGADFVDDLPLRVIDLQKYKNSNFLGEQKQSTTPFVTVFFSDNLGNVVTSIPAASVILTILKADGSASQRAPTGGEWTEIGNGLYRLTLQIGDTGILGALGISVSYVTGGGETLDYTAVFSIVAKLSFDVDADVLAVKAKTDTLPASPANEATSAAIKAKTDLLPASPANETTVMAVKAKTDNLPTDPADQSDISALLDAISGTGFVSVADSLVAIKASVDAVPGAVWDVTRSAHQTMNSFGDLMRLLKQVFSGRVKINETAGTFTVYQEDGTSVLQVQSLRDATNNAAGLQAVERLAAP